LSKEEESQETGFRALLRNKMLRFPLMVGLVLQLSQQFSGINAVFYYSTSFFDRAKFTDPWLGSVLAATVNVISTFLAIHLMDRLGRRTLLLLSSSTMALSCIALTITLYITSESVNIPITTGGTLDPTSVINNNNNSVLLGYISVGCVLLFVIFFEIGLGPIPWLIVAEIFPSRARAKAMTLAASLNWISNFIVGVTFPLLQLVLDKWTFIPFGVCSLLTFAFTIEYVPETKGKTLEDIQDEIRKRYGDQLTEQEANEAKDFVPDFSEKESAKNDLRNHDEDIL